MKTWHCYAWTAPNGKPKTPTAQWSSPAGAVEFLRRQLEAHNLYDVHTLREALKSLEAGEPVKISPTPDLHLEIEPQ